VNRDLLVGVPDVVSGTRLAAKIAHSELVGSDGEGWAVVGPANGDVGVTLTSIHAWLHEEEIDHTNVRIGDRTHTMTRE
jgi:hypothetical protein